MKIVGGVRKDCASHLVVDFPPHDRTIMLTELWDNNAEFSAEFFHMKFPHLRFLIGFNESTTKQGNRRYIWNRSIYLYGNVQPFGEKLVGFAMPLPNFDTEGCLSCSGDMGNCFANTREELASLVINQFWGTTFYKHYDNLFPRNGKIALDSLKKLSEDWDYQGLPDAPIDDYDDECVKQLT